MPLRINILQFDYNTRYNKKEIKNMGCLAVLFALSKQDVLNLKAVPRKDRAYFMHEEIEETFFDDYPEYTQELDKSWDVMHRTLTDGNLSFEEKCRPLCYAILAGEQLYGTEPANGEFTIPEGEESDIITLKTPEQVAQVAAELPKITKEWFREHYYKIDEEDYGFPLDEEDFEYTWYWFCDSLPFWERAAREKKYVLFTADQ